MWAKWQNKVFFNSILLLILLSNCERFALVALLKRATVSELLLSLLTKE